MYARTTTTEPGKFSAGLLAILVHVAFFVLLVFGITWRTQSPAPVMVDVWSSLPSPKVPRTEPKQEVTPPEPKPEPKPQPKPEPKAAPEPAPEPDIALKEKQEKKKKLEEEKRKQELEKKEEEAKKEEERLKQEKLKEAQAKKLAAQKEAQAKAAAEQAAAAAAANTKISDYITRIAAKIRSNTIIPPDVVGNPQVIYEITLLPTGEILELHLVKSSGFPSYDAAAERAIRKSTPLPIPKEDPALFASRFRTRNYVFRPDD